MDKNKLSIKIVNLEKRLDRKNATISQLENAEITDYEFINAVDGQELEPTLFLHSLFRENIFKYRRGIIGCALSHLKLWQQLILDDCNDYYIILD